MTKTLIVFYSRTGNTRKVAQVLQEELDCDLEEIKTKKSYSGAIGWFLAGKEGSQRKQAKILLPEKNPHDYELVIFGTPIWGWNISSPLRAYLMEANKKFSVQNKPIAGWNKIAAFCTMGGSYGKCFEEIEMICAKKLETQIAFKDKEVAQNEFGLLKNFIKIIKK